MVEIINGFKEYKGKVNTIALKNINLSFNDCGLYVICGASGSGKTTLLNCIAKLDELSAGEIIGYKKEDVGFIFQDFALIENLSIYNNLKIAYDMAVDQSLSIEQVLKEVNIDIPLDKKVNELSGGQKQRIAIARALLLNRKIVVADEPTGNLDHENSLNIAKILKDISKNKIVIVVTHNQFLFEEFADRIIILKDGEICSDIIKNENSSLSISNNEKNNKLKLKINTVFKMFISSTKHSLSKLILGIFILSLAMFSIMLMLNTITISKNDMFLNAINEYNFNVINFSKENKNIYDSLEKTDLEALNQIYQSYCLSHTSEYQCAIAGNSITINRIYEASMCNEALLAGEKKLDNNNIIVSYSLAKTIQNFYGKSNIEEVLGINIKINDYDVNICGITEKIKSLPKRENIEYYKKLYEKDCYYLYMNPVTISSLFYENMEESSHFNTKYIMNNKIYDYSYLYDLMNIEGNNTLNNGEIILAEKDIKNFCGDEAKKEDLIDKTYDFEFIYDNQKSKTYSLKIVGFSNYTVVNSYTYKELYTYSNEYYSLMGDIGIGIFVDDLSISLINKLETINIVPNFCLYENIISAYSITHFISLCMVAIIIPTILIAVLFLISYSNQNVLLKKKEIGILKSLGLENKEISKIFIIDSLLLICISTIVTFILLPIGVYYINKILISTGAMFNPIYFNYFFIILLILIIILIFILSFLFNLLKLNKKSDVDLVYCR